MGIGRAARFDTSHCKPDDYERDRDVRVYGFRPIVRRPETLLTCFPSDPGSVHRRDRCMGTCDGRFQCCRVAVINVAKVAGDTWPPRCNRKSLLRRLVVSILTGGWAVALHSIAALGGLAWFLTTGVLLAFRGAPKSKEAAVLI